MTTTLNTVFANPTNAQTVRFVTVDELRDILFSRKGCAFASIDAIYDMDEKMRKTNNPFFGKGIRKFATTNVMVTFDYAASVERRTDGEESAKGTGTWSQAVIRDDGTLTPLSVHKADVVSLNPLRVCVGARTYLRCEFRGSESKFVALDGGEIRKEEIDPYLKAHGERGAVDFHLVTLNKITEMRIDGMVYRIRVD